MLGEFRLLRLLGKGGMAEVYLAEQTTLQRNVAVKVLRKSTVEDESYLKRFKTEALAAAGLNHPNIVQVYMIGEDAGIQYIAQEYVQGQNLREFINRKGPPEVAVAVHIVKQVAAALQAAATAGVVHRDIKPENILLTRKGEVKVADFGLAQLTQHGERLSVTQQGVTMGTPLYMSPEQVQGSNLDQRSDIYSLGVTCYHMLTGTPPFRGESALAVAVKHLNEEPIRLEKLRPDLPPLMCEIVHRMMAKNLDERYQTAQAVIKDLKRIAQDRAPVDVPPMEAGSRVRRSNLQTAAPHRPGLRELFVVVGDAQLKRQFLALGLAMLITACGAAGIGWAMRPKNPLVNLPQLTAFVPRKKSAAEQYAYAASLLDDEAAWKAVIDDFPDAGLEGRHAQEQLAMIYLRQRRFDEARAIFDEFAGLGDSEPAWRAFGLAGQVIVYSLLDDPTQSQRVWNDLKPLYVKHLDQRMKELVADTVQKNVKRLNIRIDKQWQDAFREVRPAASE